jgi:hypothetical protein
MQQVVAGARRIACDAPLDQMRRRRKTVSGAGAAA